MRLTVKQRFYSKVALPDENGCMRWMGATSADGYGNFWADERSVRAHRYAYELMVAPIPEGLVLDHLCRVRNCVAPGHLEPVTRRVNNERGETVTARNAQATHCPAGHDYSDENTYRYPSGGRGCRKCQRAHGRAHYGANRESVLTRQRESRAQRRGEA